MKVFYVEQEDNFVIAYKFDDGYYYYNLISLWWRAESFEDVVYIGEL